jgi:hypothetical protein
LGVETMEMKQNKLSKGTWDSIDPDAPDNRIKFEINIPRTIVFMCNQPKEIAITEDDVYYSFDVEENRIKMVLNTSSRRLLKEIKKLSKYGTLFGTLVKITKVLKDGKQCFIIERVAMRDPVIY